MRTTFLFWAFNVVSLLTLLMLLAMVRKDTTVQVRFLMLFALVVGVGYYFFSERSAFYIHTSAARVQFALAGGQLQAQFRQLAVEPVQARNKPARQQTARTTEHKGRITGLPLQLGAHLAQAFKGIEGHIAQAHAGLGELDAATVLDEQGHPKLCLQRTNLSTHRAVGDVQLVRRQADAL